MAAQQGATAPASPQAGGDHRRQIATYANYSDAERAVDYLSDNGFPVQRVAIVGSDVRPVEQVVGRLNYASQRDRRDLASIRVTQPSRYEVLVDADVADRAKDMLAKRNGGS